MAVVGEYVQETVGRVLRTDRPARARKGLFGRARQIIVWPVRQWFLNAVCEAPALPGSEVYKLTAQFDAPELWARYHAFRMNPCAQTWRPLRRQIVPWQRGLPLNALIASILPLNGRKTPDVAAVDRALTVVAVTRSAPPVLSDTLRTRAYRPRR